MRIITRTSPQIWPGRARVMQKAPPARPPLRIVPTGAAPKEEEKEIEYITLAKKVEAAKQETPRPRGPRQPVRYRDVLPTAQALAKQGADINDVIAYIKDSGLIDSNGEIGYTLKELVRAAYSLKKVEEVSRPGIFGRSRTITRTSYVPDIDKLNKLKPELKEWYDQQIAAMNKVMADAREDVQRRIQQLKARGDYTSSDIQRIKTSEYPKWSKEYQAARRHLHEIQAEGGWEARSTVRCATAEEVAAKKTEYESQFPIIEVRETKVEPTITIGPTSEESAKVEADKAKGIGCPATLNTYKVAMKDGSTILVQALDKNSAKSKAKEAGYQVAWVTGRMTRIDLEEYSKVSEKVITNVGATRTLESKDIPREFRMADAETQEALGVKKVDGKWTQDVILLGDGQWVSKASFDRLPEEQQATAKDKGYDAVVKQYYVEIKNAKTGGTNLIPKEAVEELRGTEAYTGAKGTEAERLGIALTASQREFNNWLKNIERDSPDLYKIYTEQGLEALNSHIGQQREILSKLERYKPYQEYDITSAIQEYDITSAILDKSVTPNELRTAGVETSAVDEVEGLLNVQEKFKALPPVDQRNVIQMATGRLRIYVKPYDERSIEEKILILNHFKTQEKPPTIWKLQKEYAKQFSLEPIVAYTPIAGTIYFWDEMPTYGKIISIVGDIACLGFVIHGAAAGARAARGYTAAARMKAAAKGAGEMILAEITAPGEVIAHPIATAKGIGKQVRSVVETLVHPKKLPLGSAEITYTTGRLPVEDVGGAAKATELRDAAVKAAIRGEKATATVDGVTLTLNPSELQKVGGAVGVHATPDIRPYLNGAVVEGGAEGSGIFISPNFHSRFAQATAFGDVPEGGIKGGLIIRDQNVLKAISPSGKTYAGTVEIEALLKQGITLPPPSQVLFTRDIAGNKLTLLVIGDPFTSSQIAKLKFLGSLDTVGQIFKPTMKLTGAQKTAINAMDDIIELAQERATLTRQLGAAQTAGRVALAQELGPRIARIDEKISDLVNRVNVPRETIRSSDIVWAQYTDKGLLERWGELNPGEATRTDRGTRLPDIETTPIIRRARLARKERGVPVIERKAPAGGRRVPPEERRAAPGTYRAPTYPRLYSPAYVPPYAPPYVPSKALPFAPVKPPAYAPPYVPPYVPPRVPPRGPSKPPPLRVERVPVKLGRERIPMPGQSLISWRQGMYYITVVEPYRTTGTKPDVIYSRHRPPWGKVVKGRYSPSRSLKSIGKVPKSVKLPMGVVTAHVKNGRRLRFLAD